MSTHQKRIRFEIQARHQAVTGSCILCKVTFPNTDIFKFIVDAGSFQEDYSFLNRIADFNVSDIDHVFLTHNHSDHIGAVPAFVKRGFCGKFHTTKQTKALLPTSLFDSAKIELKDSSYTGLPPVYTEEEVIDALQLVKGYDYEEIIEINPHVTVTFFENGHMRGSAIILFQFKQENEELNLVFTGDYNDKNYFFTPKKLPAWVKNLKNVIIVEEATYGTTNSNDIIETFDKDIPKIIQSGKSILIPCIAQERYEIVLAHLRKLQEAGEISTDVQIYGDGPLAITYLQKYVKAYGSDFIPFDFKEVDPNFRTLIPKTLKQCIVLTTSGMCTNGPAQLYLKSLVSNENWALYFTCYQAEGTIGRELLDFNLSHGLGEEIELWGEKYSYKISTYSTSEFSSHAKCDTLINFVSQFKSLIAILVNHGEIEVKQAYANTLKELEICENVLVLSREQYFVLDRLGIVSTNNTKFIMEEPVKQQKQIASYKKNKKDNVKRRSSRVRIRVFANPRFSYQFYSS